MFTRIGLRHRMRRIGAVAVIVAACAASLLPSSAGAAAAATNVVDTPAKVVALLSAQKTSAQLEAALARLAPAEQQYVIDQGLTPARVDVSTSSTSPLAMPQFGTRSTAVADAASCSGFSSTHNATAVARSWAGLWLFTYFSDWQWGGCRGRTVNWAHHQERGDTQVGWSYDGETWGAHYGCTPCWFVGRETFGHFSFIKFAVHDTADLQVQVNAGPGWWAWANITGP